MRRSILFIGCTLMLCITEISIAYAADAVVGIVRSDNSVLKEPVAPDRSLSVG